MTKKEKGLIKDALWNLFWGGCLKSPTKLIDGFRKLIEFVEQRRIYWLFQSMGANSHNPSEKYKEELSKLIETENGQEQIEDFINATLATSSKTAITAMGILLSNLEHENYDEEFRRLSCKALHGITEDLVNTFLPLCELKSVGDDGTMWIGDTPAAKATEPALPPYDVVQLNAEILDKSPTIKAAVKSPEDAFASVNELTRRGMFLPDYVSSRTAPANGWGIYFGVTRTSFRLKELLLKAKNISEQFKNEPAMESQEDD
jgi:hypothetical protein